MTAAMSKALFIKKFQFDGVQIQSQTGLLLFTRSVGTGHFGSRLWNQSLSGSCGFATLCTPLGRLTRQKGGPTSALHGALQSALRFAVRTTFPHFSVSSEICFAKSDGDPPNTVAPRSANRAFNFESASPALISRLSLSTISAGVFLGAH